MTHSAVTQSRAPALGSLMAAVLTGALAGGILVAVVYGGLVVDIAPREQQGAALNSALVKAEQEWERQRHQQSGYVEPAADVIEPVRTDDDTPFDLRSWSEPMPE